MDLAEALAFAAEGKVRAHIHQAPLSEINAIFGGVEFADRDHAAVLGVQHISFQAAIPGEDLGQVVSAQGGTVDLLRRFLGQP